MCLNNKDSETYRGNRGISSLKRMKFSIKMLRTTPKELKLFANFDVKYVKMANPSQKWEGDLIFWNFKFKIKLWFAVYALIIAKKRDFGLHYENNVKLKITTNILSFQMSF